MGTVIRQRRRVDGTYGLISIRGVSIACSTPVAPVHECPANRLVSGRWRGRLRSITMRPEPNFARLITEDDLDHLEIAAHALQRFAEGL